MREKNGLNRLFLWLTRRHCLRCVVSLHKIPATISEPAMSRISARSCIIISALVVAVLCAKRVSAQEEYQPKIAEASGDAELALKGFVLPEGMSGKLLAAEPMLANPVAFTITNDGRIIVCETFRQEVGVEDNRNHMNWLENDLQLESIEERAAMFRKYMGDDVQKWSQEHDRLRMLQDTDGDGKFDRDTLFADGFNDIVDGTGAGVIEHNGQIYYTCIPKLWMFSDADKDGVADSSEALHHGYGVRVAFRGHDMHGLVIGPDGRLYFSIGDRGFNVITKEGTRLKRVDTGAVFRCDMDGSNLEVFAYGLRNPQELAFDDHGNLFTGDNNSDSGDKARWVYVVQDGDTGWRMYYQYLDDRGPWKRERIWYPYQADEQTTAVQPASIIPPIANLADGPSGLTYYPGIGLPERYAGHFFMADFRGTAGNSGIRSFTVNPKGATFELADSHQFLWSILATDVTFAPDGGIVVSDWVNGWNGEGKGRLYRFSNDKEISNSATAKSAEWLAGGIAATSVPTLVELLQHVDRRVRQEAQFELVRRNAVDDLLAAASNTTHEVSARHGLWGCWQLGLSAKENTGPVFELLLHAISDESNSYSDELQSQALRIAADLVSRHGISVLNEKMRSDLASACRAMSKNENLRVAGFAAAALAAVGKSTDSSTLLMLLDRANNSDPIVRHQATMGLVKLAERQPRLLESLAQYAGTPGRLGVALAMRRLGNPAIAQFLSDSDSLLIAEAARAINDDALESAQTALADLMTTPGLEDSVLRRSMNACYRLGSAERASAVARVAADAEQPASIRLLAAQLLASWNNPQNTDTVTGRWRPVAAREVDGLQDAVGTYLPGMLAGSPELRKKTVEIATELGISDIVPTLEGILHDTNLEDNLRVSAFRALAKLSSDVEAVLAAGLKDPSESVRLSAVELMTARSPKLAVPQLVELLNQGSVKAQQTALRLLGPIRTDESQQAILSAFDRLQQQQFPAGAVLDALLAAEAAKTPELQAAVKSFRERQQEVGTILAGWSECLEGGNAEQGRSIFFGRSAASCRRCHKVSGSGGEVGPDLSRIGKDKDRNYLLEAIVDPNAKVAKGFETVILVTIEGRIHSGILKSEDDNIVQLMTPTDALVSVAKEDIDERANGQSGMPQDLVKNLTRSEIRDLVEYLTTLKSESDTSHGKSEK